MFVQTNYFPPFATTVQLQKSFDDIISNVSGSQNKEKKKLEFIHCTSGREIGVYQ